MYGTKRTARDRTNAQIIDHLVKASSMREEEILFVLEHVQDKPEAITAFKNFAIKSKFLFADELGEIVRAEMKRKATNDAYFAKKEKEYQEFKAKVAELYQFIQNAPGPTSYSIPSHLQDALEYCLRKQYIKRTWFRRLKIICEADFNSSNFYFARY